jgi:hypothetical protein
VSCSSYLFWRQQGQVEKAKPPLPLSVINATLKLVTNVERAKEDGWLEIDEGRWCGIQG